MAKTPPAVAQKKTKISMEYYVQFIGSLKTKIRSAQLKAAVALNSELITLYWEIGKEIVAKQGSRRLGSGVQEKVAKDFQNGFPSVEGLVNNIQKCLIELGQGFAFVGQRYPLKADAKDLFIDLLFYHLKLKCYIVVELKAGEFGSRDAGQMSAYLSAVDDQLRNEGDKPSIGLIFCQTKDNVFVEYVLRNFNRPIGVAEFEVKLVESLPKVLKDSLPTVEEIEAELGGIPQKKRLRGKKG